MGYDLNNEPNCARCGCEAKDHIQRNSPDDIAFLYDCNSCDCEEYADILMKPPPFELVQLTKDKLKVGLAVYHPGLQDSRGPDWSYRYDLGLITDLQKKALGFSPGMNFAHRSFL